MEPLRRSYTVRWADCDANGHMRNTAYSEYCIELRMAFLAERGWGFDQFRVHGFGPVILREEIDYLREVGLGDVITVGLDVGGLSPEGARWRMVHDITRADGRPSARVTVAGGWLDLSARKLMVPPPELQSLFANVTRAEGFVELPPLGASAFKKG